MTQSLMSTDSKVLPLLPLCLPLRVPQHNSLSLTCAHDILLVTILTLPISISSLLSRVHLHLVAAKRGANLFFIICMVGAKCIQEVYSTMQDNCYTYMHALHYSYGMMQCINTPAPELM